MIYKAFRNVCVEVLTFNETEKELVHDLNMRPGDFQHGFILLGVKCLALRIHWRRYWPEQILAKHIDHSRVHWLCDDLSVVCDVV